MRVKLEYYVILTIQIYKEDRERYSSPEPNLTDIKPSVVKFPKFHVTEDTPEDSDIKKHRKYVGIISPEDLKNLIEEADFENADETMGSITLDYGWMPAISFSAYAERHGINAYITPIPEREDEEILMRELDSHPQREIVVKKVNRKLSQCLEVLKDVLKTEALPKSFFVDVNQLSFDFAG